MQPLLDRGALPNLQRFVDEGVSAPMESELPCLSIVLWTSVATGKLPEQHGIRDWSYVDPDSGEQGLMSSTRRLVPALWNISTAAGLRVGFVNWWATWPAEPVNGFIVSEQFTRARAGEVLDRGTFPDALMEELALGGESLDWPWLSEQLRSGALKVLSDRVGAGAASSLEERTRQALFLLRPGLSGRNGHVPPAGQSATPTTPRLPVAENRHRIALHVAVRLEPRVQPRLQQCPERRRAVSAMEPVYRYEDELLGRLLAAAGHDINVVILADHGFRWESDGWGHEETAPPGIFLAMGPAFKKSQRLASVRLYDIAPTVLHLLHMPVGKDMAGEVLVDAFADNRPSRWIESYDGLVDHRRPPTRRAPSKSASSKPSGTCARGRAACRA